MVSKYFSLPFFTLLLSLLIPQYTHAQQAELLGRISNEQTKEPLISVTVYAGNGMGTTTNDGGFYTLALEAGTYTIRYSMIGFEEVNQQFALLPGEKKLFDVMMKELADELNIVVISAGKFEQDLGEITVSMEVLKPDMIRNKNTTSMDDVLQQTPGVSIVDDEPQIRSGSGYSFGAGSRVQVLIDDLPMLSGDAGKASWGFLPVENLEQVEVIKGASSVLYGSAALSGVINVRTAYPKDKPQTRITAFHGVYSTPRSDSAKYWSATSQMSGINFFHSQQLGQWDLVVGGNFFGDDGPLGPITDSLGNFNETGYDPLTVDRYEGNARGRINANIRYRFPNTPGLSAGVNTNWSKSESLSALIWENSGSGLYQAFAGSSTRTKQVQGYVDPFIQYSSPNGMKHLVRMRWFSLDNNNDNDQGNYSDIYYGEYQFQMNFDSLNMNEMMLTAGIVNTQTNARGELFTGENKDGINKASNKAFYAQLDKKFFDKLSVSAGVRYEVFRINEESESKPVFRGGLNYAFGKASYLRASYGQGFRFPSIAEKYIITDVGALVIFPNPELKSETSYNAEIGIKQGFKVGNILGFADVAIFQQEYENFIEFTFGQWAIPAALSIEAFQKSIGFKSVNTGKARIRGVDFSLIGQGKIGRVEIQVLGGYTFTRPVSLTPEVEYGISPVPPDHPLSAENFDTLTYINTSSNPANNILKYRLEHLVRFDLEARYHNAFLGSSFRSNSHMQNIDAIFEELEIYYPAVFNTGLKKWRTEHTKGDYVIDFRVGYNLTTHHRLAIIVSNALNREYAIRPLAIEDPRLTTIQYTLTL